MLHLTGIVLHAEVVRERVANVVEPLRYSLRRGWLGIETRPVRLHEALEPQGTLSTATILSFGTLDISSLISLEEPDREATDDTRRSAICISTWRLRNSVVAG
jgi:hypothetical protein